MEELNNANNNNNYNYNYQKEKKFKDKLKDEIIFLTRNNLKTSVDAFQGFVDKAFNYIYQKRVPLIKEFCAENVDAEESKKKAEEKVEEENNKLNKAFSEIKKNIKNELEDKYNADIRELHKGIDEIFDTNNINKNIKKAYNDIKNNNYSSEKITENLDNSIKKYEETFRKYLLKKMKYKEELEIYNSRQQQILNENIDCKKDYNDINNYLNNFKIDVKANNDINKLNGLIQSVKEFNLNNMNNN